MATFSIGFIVRLCECDTIGNFNGTISNMNQANIVPSLVLLSKSE